MAASSERQMVPVMHQVGLPQVRIEEPILNPSFRYGVDVNPQKFAQLLVASGLPAEETPDYTLEIKTWDESGENKLGVYFPAIKTMDIFVESNLHEYYKARGDLEAFRRGYGDTIEKPFDFLVTKRLPNYLKNAPQDRADKFTRSLFDRALKRSLRTVVIHEANHVVVVDEIKNGVLFAGLGNYVAETVHRFKERIKPSNKPGPIEVLARKAEKNLRLNNVADGILDLRFK